MAESGRFCDLQPISHNHGAAFPREVSKIVLGLGFILFGKIFMFGFIDKFSQCKFGIFVYLLISGCYNFYY